MSDASWFAFAEGAETVFLAGLALGSAVSVLPAEHIGWLGLIPLSLGLRGLWQNVRGNAAGAAVVTGVLPVIGILLANSSNTLAVLAPSIAETGHLYSLPLLLGFIEGPLIMVALLRPLLANRALRGALARLGPYFAPAIMICVGLYILADSPSDSY